MTTILSPDKTSDRFAARACEAAVLLSIVTTDCRDVATICAALVAALLYHRRTEIDPADALIEIEEYIAERMVFFAKNERGQL